MIETLRKCRKCSAEKAPIDFYQSRSTQCKKCVDEYNRQYKRDHREAHNAWQRKRYRRRDEKLREAHLRRSYGIGIEEYGVMFEAQNGVCAICRQPEREGKDGPRLLAVDHCHATGKVRGLLCFNCNAALGNLGDDAALLRAALTYLEESKCP